MGKPKGDMGEVVRKMASLANLRFDPKKLSTFTQKAEAVLSYVEQLSELDTSGIDPTSHAADLKTPLRKDEAKDSGVQDGIIENAPARNGEFFQVPRILEGE